MALPELSGAELEELCTTKALTFSSYMIERMEGGLAEQEPGWWDWGSAYYQPEWK